jgi:hypothetical protein
MGVEAASGSGNTCVILGCSADSITLATFGQMTVSVVNTANVAQPNLPVYVYRVVEITPEATAIPEPTPTTEPTQQPTEEPEENVANQTELVETSIIGTTDITDNAGWQTVAEHHTALW